MALDFHSYTPGQKQAIQTLDKPLFVAAGAGSGKTFTLTKRVVWALSKGSGTDGGAYLDSLDQALIITFTNEAAKEIKERMRSALEEEGLFDQALNVDSAWISTIHSMCARILRSHAFDLGIDPDFIVLDEHRRNELLQESLEEVLSSLRETDEYKGFFSVFDLKDTASISYGGAQNGGQKLDGIIEQLATSALSAPYEFESIELAIEKDGAVPDIYQELKRLHFQMRELLMHAAEIDDETAVNIITRQEEKVAAYLANHTKQDVQPSEIADLFEKIPRLHCGKETKKLAADIQSDSEDLQKTCRMLDINRYAPQLIKVTKFVVDRFSKKKREAQGLDNNDLLHEVARAFEDHPELAGEYSSKFKLVMVDEFQDTNEQQVRMIKRLAGEDARFLTTVGDAQQSIYGFREADVEVFFKRQKEIPEENRPLLIDNFRSHDDILRFVKAVCGAEGMIPDFMDLKASRQESSGPLQNNTPRVMVELTAVEKKGNKRAAKADVHHRVAAEQLADRIARIIFEGVFQAKDIAILMTSVKDAGLYIEALRQRGIESVLSGGTGFGQLPEVQTIAALLSTLADIHDTEQGLFPVLTSGMFSLEASDFVLLSTDLTKREGFVFKRPIEGGLLTQEFSGDHQPSCRLKRALTILNQAKRDIAVKDVATVIQQVVKASGWIERLETGDAQERSQAANILAAIRRVRELERDLGVGPSQLSVAFKHWLKVTKAAPVVLNDERQDAVKIQTIHASKGKEYKVVAVVGALKDLDQRAPSTKRCLIGRVGAKRIVALKPPRTELRGDKIPEDISQCKTICDWRLYLDETQNAAAQAEAIRLLYVGLTRAREMVILTATAIQQKAAGFSPKLTKAVISSILKEDSLPRAGELPFEYGGSQAGVCRTLYVRFSEQADGYVLDGVDFDQTRTMSDAQENQAGLTFDLYAPETSVPQAKKETNYQEFYSYSSLHQQINDKFQEVSEQQETLQEKEASQDGGAEGETSATSFGSAFHELAQYMVEADTYPERSTIERIAIQNHVQKSLMSRLESALTLWNNSDVRAEARKYARVCAEVPFCLEQVYGYKKYLNGAIDLLATNPKSTEAFVVDYKTGDKNRTPEEIIESHRMQANFYAFVLMQRGYTKVTCAFVCVEVPDEADKKQPFVARYSFDEHRKPTLLGWEVRERV